MADLDQIGWTSTGILTGGLQSGFAIYGQMMQAEAQAQALEEQARVELLEGYREEERLRDLNRERMRKIRESIGASGVRGDVGTALDFAVDQYAEGELDALNARFAGIYSSSVKRAAAKNVKEGSVLTAAGQTFSGIAGGGQKLLSFAGAFGGGSSAAASRGTEPGAFGKAYHRAGDSTYQRGYGIYGSGPTSRYGGGRRGTSGTGTVR